MYIYSRTVYPYSSYGLTMKKIKRTQERLQKQVDNAEDKLKKQEAAEKAQKDAQKKPVRTESSAGLKSNLLGDLFFNPGGAAAGTFVDVLPGKGFFGGTGSFLDVIGSGDTGGVGMVDVLGNTGGGNLINILTGVTSSSVVETSAVSEQIVDPMTKKVQGILAANAIGSALDVKA